MFRNILCGNVPWQDVTTEPNKTSLPWNKTLSMLNYTQSFQLLLDIERREAEKKIRFMLHSQRITKGEKENELFRYPAWQDYVPWQDVIAELNKTSLPWNKTLSMLNHTQRFQFLIEIERREAEKQIRFMLQSQRITKGGKENELFRYRPWQEYVPWQDIIAEEKENKLFENSPWQDYVPWQDVIAELNKTNIERRQAEKKMRFMLQSQRITKGGKENELFRYRPWQEYVPWQDVIAEEKENKLFENPPWQDYVPWQDVIAELNKTSLPWNRTL
ncbi:hypothetical protein J6590_105999, partial [Homalodisca vitripennis]